MRSSVDGLKSTYTNPTTRNVLELTGTTCFFPVEDVTAFDSVTNFRLSSSPGLGLVRNFFY